MFSIAAMGALCIYRAYDYWVTGFYVSDEFGYAKEAITGAFYGYRWIFGLVNIFFFRVLGITAGTRFWLFLPIYLFLWALVTIYVYYRILKLLGLDERTVGLSLISSLFLVAFVLLSLGFLTEPVGLSFSMVGIYFMIRWLKQPDTRGAQFIINPLFAALSFAAAEGTREPYLIFPIGSMILMPFVVGHSSKSPGNISVTQKRKLLTASVLAFVIPSVFFLQYPNSIFSAEGTPAATSLVTGISSATPPPQIVTMSINVSSIVTHTLVSNVTQTFVSNGVTSTTTYAVTTVTTQTTTVSTQIVETPQPNPLARTRLGNTLLIFFGGLFLGWGPIMFLLGLTGFIVLAFSIRKADNLRRLVFLLALFALGSYFVVSFIFSSDPFYLSFSNYSTIIRFSDSALPAYFLLAPFIIAKIANRRPRAIALVGVWLAFVVIAVPVYETYASSSMVTYAGSNPFSLNFRTDAVLIRDYIAGHQGEAPFYIIGWPNGWDFTPGVDLLPSTHAYYFATNPAIPYILYSQFVSNKWPTVYIYFTSNQGEIKANAPYLLALIGPGLQSGNQTYPFSVTSRQVVLQGSDFSLIKVDLSWS